MQQPIDGIGLAGNEEDGPRTGHNTGDAGSAKHNKIRKKRAAISGNGTSSYRRVFMVHCGAGVDQQIYPATCRGEFRNGISNSCKM